MHEKYINAAIGNVNSLPLTPEVKGQLGEIKTAIELLMAGNKRAVKQTLTKWRDVNNTMKLAGKLRGLQQRAKRGQCVVNLLYNIAQAASMFAPGLKVVAAIIPKPKPVALPKPVPAPKPVIAPKPAPVVLKPVVAKPVPKPAPAPKPEPSKPTILPLPCFTRTKLEAMGMKELRKIGAKLDVKGRSKGVIIENILDAQ